MRIEARLRDSARRFGEKTALIAGAVRLTYADLDAQSDRLAAGLMRAGIRPGDRVLMVLDNCHEAVLSFFGAWKAGAVPCPLYPAIKAEKLSSILGSTEASAIVAQARQRPMVDAAIAMTKIRPVLIVAQAGAGEEIGDALRFEALLAGEPKSPLRERANSEALALLIHTSGSTGRPKGVMLTHANVAAACDAIVSYLGNTADDIVLNVLPLSFGYGITQVVTMVTVGGTLVLEKSFAFPRKILERLGEVKATGFPLVPPMAALITGMKDLAPGFLPHLRYITSAAAAMPPAFTERLQQLLPRTQLFLMYGQTECLRATYLPPEEVSRRPLSVGHAIPGGTAFVVDEDGRPVPPGTIGELVVEGPHVMPGYWGDGLASVRALSPAADGRRLHTGDLFRADADGFLYFISRRDDIIKTRGEKVSPQEVERALYALPGIREAAVGGVDDPVFGQAIRAYVVLEDGATLTEREIIHHCAGQLEDYMVPKSVEFRDALPRTTTGKIRLGAGETSEIIRENVA
ncbi:class I adenylate-forming enzyme family protein [Neorhizobium sp. CSC1952]|uniref:class I adenylate-forming enzyme family protein n=1 Tax=Neorhizobium sp. CSC1952 TaxID=2978974 RepID=UPI0025A681BA|nr:class I adenylate-forming enzyme family protein [Rhizobium sp. CSC1952]WJR68235.1 class I adenylate-forming enzyme family protein [Rhizobium sp. CSC1952]